MLRILVAIFLALHGLVHLLYVGQSRRLFELQPGMVWPDGAWALARFVGNEATRTAASALLLLATLAFLGAGTGLLARLAWWQPVALAAAVLSSFTFLLLWDGGWDHLDDKGAVALLINLAIVIALLVFHWPAFGF